MNAKRNAALSLVLTLCLVSCATRTKPVINPTIPQTALQWTIILNASVAKANRTVEQTAEVVQKQGLITVAQARPVIVASGKVATVSESIRAITSAGTEATWAIDGPKIRALLASANLTIPASGNQAVDLVVATLNAALTVLTQEVR